MNLYHASEETVTSLHSLSFVGGLWDFLGFMSFVGFVGFMGLMGFMGFMRFVGIMLASLLT